MQNFEDIKNPENHSYMIQQFHSKSDYQTDDALNKGRKTSWNPRQIYAMVLNPEEIAITTKVLGMEDVVGPDTFIVALVRPEAPAGERRRSPQNVPRKALMNLVSDLCETRSAAHNNFFFL